MAKFVRDAAIMLGALESASFDSNDPATRRCSPPAGRDYTKFLNKDGLKGARIGIPRAFYYDRLKGRGGLAPEALKVMEEAIDVLKKQGAVIVDPANIPSPAGADARATQLWPTHS